MVAFCQCHGPQRRGRERQAERQRSLGPDLLRSLSAAPGIDRAGQDREESQQRSEGPRSQTLARRILHHPAPTLGGENGHRGKTGEKIRGELGSCERKEEERRQNPAEQECHPPALRTLQAPSTLERLPHGEGKRRTPGKQPDHQNRKIVVHRPGMMMNRGRVSLEIAVDDEILPEQPAVTQRNGDVPGSGHQKEGGQTPDPGNPPHLPHSKGENQVGTRHEGREDDAHGPLGERGAPRCAESDRVPKPRRSPAFGCAKEGHERQRYAKRQRHVGHRRPGIPEVLQGRGQNDSRPQGRDFIAMLSGERPGQKHSRSAEEDAGQACRQLPGSQ